MDEPRLKRSRPVRQLALAAVWLTSPAWALALFLGLASLSRAARAMPGEPLIVLGLLAPFAGAGPIFRTSAGPGSKTPIFCVHHLLCAAAMFITGWAAIGAFLHATRAPRGAAAAVRRHVHLPRSSDATAI